VVGHGHVSLHFVELEYLRDGQGIFLSIDLAVFKSVIDLVDVDRTGSAPRALNVSANICPAGKRMRMPSKSFGTTIGRLLVEV
jgi:hypothetical protein